MVWVVKSYVAGDDRIDGCTDPCGRFGMSYWWRGSTLQPSNVTPYFFARACICVLAVQMWSRSKGSGRTTINIWSVCDVSSAYPAASIPVPKKSGDDLAPEFQAEPASQNNSISDRHRARFA